MSLKVDIFRKYKLGLSLPECQDKVVAVLSVGPVGGPVPQPLPGARELLLKGGLAQ